jgi:hypothetical protein
MVLGIYSPASPAYTDVSHPLGGTTACDHAGIDEERSDRSTCGSGRGQRGSGGFGDSVVQHATVRRSTVRSTRALGLGGSSWPRLGSQYTVAGSAEKEMMAWASDHGALTDNVVHLVGPARVGLDRFLALSAGHQALPHIASDFKQVVVLIAFVSHEPPYKPDPTIPRLPSYPTWILGFDPVVGACVCVLAHL